MLENNLKQLKEQINKNLKKRFIKKLSSLIASFVILVSKKRTNKKRIVIDYKKLNVATVKD